MIEASLPALRRYASTLLEDKREQDALVYACLVRALDRLHRLRGSRNLKIWLFSILHNVYVRQQRRRRARTNATSLGSGVVDQVGMSVDQDTRLACATLRALYALPLVQRQVLILTSVEDMSYAEVAEVLGIPVSSVMSYLSLGREQLRQKVEGQNTNSGTR